MQAFFKKTKNFLCSKCKEIESEKEVRKRIDEVNEEVILTNAHNLKWHADAWQEFKVETSAFISCGIFCDDDSEFIGRYLHKNDKNGSATISVVIGEFNKLLPIINGVTCKRSGNAPIYVACVEVGERKFIFRVAGWFPKKTVVLKSL